MRRGGRDIDIDIHIIVVIVIRGGEASFAGSLEGLLASFPGGFQGLLPDFHPLLAKLVSCFARGATSFGGSFLRLLAGLTSLLAGFLSGVAGVAASFFGGFLRPFASLAGLGANFFGLLTGFFGLFASAGTGFTRDLRFGSRARTRAMLVVDGALVVVGDPNGAMAGERSHGAEQQNANDDAGIGPTISHSSPLSRLRA